MDRMREAVREALVQEPSVTVKGVAVGRCRFDADFPGFSGHFPGRPLLPAVVQVMAALQVAAEAWSDITVEVVSVEKAKFLLPVVPGEEMEIHCERMPARPGPCVSARLFVRGEVVSSFLVTTAPVGGAP